MVCIMDNDADIQKIISLFEKLKDQEPRCGDMLCTTCGGYGFAIIGKLSDEDFQNINKLLLQVSPKDYEKFGIWTVLLERISPFGVASVRARKVQSLVESLDLSDIRSVDRFLFGCKDHYKFSSFEKDYLSTLEHAIPMAIDTSDASLVETLVIILGKQATNYPELVNVAIKLSQNDINIQRVLRGFNYQVQLQ